MTFNFIEYKNLLCKAYQTTDFQVAMRLGRKEYLNTFEEPLPYPIQDYPEEYEAFCNLLHEKIEQLDLLDISYISKSEAKTRYKLNDIFFEKYYSQPDQKVLIKDSKERFGKTMFSFLYNENRIIQILDSQEYLDYVATKKLKKSKYLNY